jgi:hypothetical protein
MVQAAVRATPPSREKERKSGVVCRATSVCIIDGAYWFARARPQQTSMKTDMYTKPLLRRRK